MSYAANSIATGGTPSPAATVGAGSVLGQQAPKRKYSLQSAGTGQQDPGTLDPNEQALTSGIYNPSSGSFRAYGSQSPYETALASASNNLSSAITAGQARGASFQANSAETSRLAAQANAPGVNPSSYAHAYGAPGEVNAFAAGPAAAAPSTPAQAGGGVLDQISGALKQAASTSPYQEGTAAYQARYNGGLDNVTRGFGGLDQQVTARGAAGGRVSSADYVNMGAEEKQAVSDYQNNFEANAPLQQQQYLGGVLGNLGLVQGQGFNAQMQPLDVESKTLSNRLATQLQPYQVGAASLANAGTAQTQSQSGQLFGGQLQEQGLRNSALGLQVQQQLGTLQANITNAKSAAELTAAQAAEAKFKSDNVGLLTALGFVSSVASAAGAVAGKMG